MDYIKATVRKSKILVLLCFWRVIRSSNRILIWNLAMYAHLYFQRLRQEANSRWNRKELYPKSVESR
jgi:hypothetical protein